MERNIDRNLRMARREVRRFFGGSRRIAGEAVFIVAMIIVSTVYFATERGLIILVGILAVAALIFFILERVFGVYLWGRPLLPSFEGRHPPVVSTGCCGFRSCKAISPSPSAARQPMQIPAKPLAVRLWWIPVPRQTR
jgi:hypothetical protein